MLLERRAVCGRPSCLPRAERIRSVGGKKRGGRSGAGRGAPSNQGDVNVQVILEEFGGGGHFTMAGAQIKNMTMSDARRALIRALDGKLAEMTAQN